jgi:hypothetical protein
MTSSTSYTSQVVNIDDDQQLAEYPATNGILFNRLLSPIVECSTEILSMSFPIERIYSNTMDKRLNTCLADNRPIVDPLDSILREQFIQSIDTIHKIGKYFDSIDHHLKQVTMIIEQLHDDDNIMNAIEPISTRLIPIRTKAKQINHLVKRTAVEHRYVQVRCQYSSFKMNTIDL